MVPRRLLTVMLLLLVGLVIASAVAPPSDRDGQETARTQTSTTPATTEKPASTTTRAAGAAGASADGVLPRDKTVDARAGQAIELAVTAEKAATIEIPALGAMQPAAPGAPAQFVVAFDAPGRYDVRDIDAGASVGTVVISE